MPDSSITSIIDHGPLRIEYAIIVHTGHAQTDEKVAQLLTTDVVRADTVDDITTAHTTRRQRSDD
jgi:hypothetical protein